MEHLEGRQSVLAALQACQRRFEVILIAHGAHLDKLQDVVSLAEQRGVPVSRVDRAQLDAMAHGATHGGVLAVVSPKPRLGAEDLLKLVESCKTPPMLLLIEGVEDARNLGFTLRSAEALGASAVLIKKHLWDLDNVEIARPASGAYERLPLAQIDSVEPLQALRRKGLRLYGCIAGARRRVYDVNLIRGCILAIGGEKRGLSGAVRRICDRFITIPTMAGGVSLSLSHAACLVMAESMRQRLSQTAPAALDESAASAEETPDPATEGLPDPELS